MADEKVTTKASEEQIIYANLLSYGTWIGLAIMVVTFVLYVAKILPPVIPIEDLSKYWTMSVTDYMHAAELPHGWGWVRLAGHGDFVNFVGIVMLAGLTVVCYAAIIPSLLKKKDTTYVVIAIIEIAILVLAASGILTAGGH